MQLKFAGIVISLSLLLGSTASAQTSRGTVTGVITDQSKAAIPRAAVDIRNKETNVVRSTTTNDSGVYRFDAVDPGIYDVVIKAQGFKTSSRREIPVSAAQVIAIDSNLEIGEVASVIEVTSEAPALQTEAPVRGGTLSATQVNKLPVFSRNPNMLAIILPGVTEQRADLPGTSTFSVNGSRGRSNNFLLDGTENNDISVAGQGFQIKNPETVQEVSVQTANYDAEFGRAGGAVVNTITKSGTNQLHGTLGYTPDFTNDDAITNTLSTDPDIQKRGKLPPGYQQYFSGTIGGPIRKDRTFFFTSWQEERRKATNTSVFTTPTAAGRAAIRAAVPVGTNPNVDRYLDITSSVPGVGNPFTFDMGNGRGLAQFGAGVYAYPYSFNGRQSVTKGDHRFSDKDLLSLRYGYDRIRNQTATANFPGFQTSQFNNYHTVLLTETHIFSPRLTNEFRLPFNRIALDFPNNATNPLGQTLPVTAITSLTSIGVSASYPQGRIANNYGIQDTMSYVQGKHNFRFGFDLLNQRSKQFAPATFRGQLNYAASNAGGQVFSQFANFIDDFAGTGGPTRDFGNAAYYPRLFRQAYFFTDRWQVRPNVTLTLGVRYEDFGTPVNSLATPAFTGLFNVKPNPSTKIPSGPFNQPNTTVHDFNNFAPSLGLTWSPSFKDGLLGQLIGDRKTVFRTGYNIGYDSFFNNIASNAATSAPNFVSTNIVSTPGANGQGNRGLAQLSKLIPNEARTIRPDDSQSLVLGDLRNPYYQKFSFGFQRELPFGLVAEAAYLGTSGTRLYINEDLNPAVVNPALRILPQGYSSLTQLAADVNYTLQPRFDPLQGSRSIRTNGGHSSYHSGQFQLSKRFTKDFGLNLAYTRSKLLDNASEVFTYNNSTPNSAIPSVFGGQKLEKALSLYDRPHRLVISYNYVLPIYKSQRGIVGRVLGGWGASGLYTIESGVPYTVGNGADADGLGGAGDRADINPNGKAGVRAQPNAASPTGYFNPDVPDPNNPGRFINTPINPNDARYIGLLACTSPFTNCRAGNAPRNSERTPRVNNVSLFISKSVRMTERLSMDFRTEMFNALNHPQYGYANPSVFLPGGGTPASTVNTSAAGRFLNMTVLDGGGRQIRYNLTLRF